MTTVTLHGSLTFGPLTARVDEAMRDTYLFNVASAALTGVDDGDAMDPVEVAETLTAYADGSLLWEEAVEELGGTVPAKPFDLVAHLTRQREFSLKTFGPGPRTKGVLDHIRKELVEIEAASSDLGEWVDLILLALDGAWRAGWEPQQIVDGIDAKQTKNEARDWPDWRTADHQVDADPKLRTLLGPAFPSAAEGCDHG